MPKTRQKTRKAAARAPKQQRSRDTRAAILKAASQLFGQRGYGEVTTNHVAQRAGVSIGSLYEYFRDKDAIVRELVDAHLTSAEQLFASHAQMLLKDAHTRPLAEVLARLVETMLLFHADDPKAHRFLASEVRLGRVQRARVARLEEGAVALIAGLLSSHPGACVRRPAFAARMLVQTVDALTHRWILEPSGAPVPVKQLADELTRMLTAYVT
jgi:AcrR family transcriptional regulator